MHSKNLIIQLKEGARIEHIPELKPATIPSGCIRIEPLYKNPGGTGFNERERTAGLHRTYLLKFDNRTDLIEFRKHLQPSEGIEYIEEDEVNQACTEPNDPYWGKLWGLRKIVCVPAWNISQGEGVIVAVIDTGVDLQHRDLIANLWKDEQGAHGYDFINEDDNPDDDNGHGTAIAGVIAAVLNNNIGVVGVAPGARIMPIKCLDEQKEGLSSVLARGIRYAVNNGARIINNSWGPGYGRTLGRIIDYAYESNCLVSFAAGNGNRMVDPDAAPAHPRAICVAATDNSDARLSTSNFGEVVDVSAPGYKIFSTQLNNSFAEFGGTSMACAHLSGVLALMASLYPGIDLARVREVLQQTSDPHDHEPFKPIGTGRVNALKALDYVKRNMVPNNERRQKMPAAVI